MVFILIVPAWIQWSGKSPAMMSVRFRVWFMVLNATFNNISGISWRSVLLVKETRVPREKNHWPVASHWQTLSNDVKGENLSHRFATISSVVFLYSMPYIFILNKVEYFLQRYLRCAFQSIFLYQKWLNFTEKSHICSLFAVS